MGEQRRTNGDQGETERRHTVAAAAELLGVSQEAIRMRIKRGTLRSEREGGHVYVILNAEQTRPTSDHEQDTTSDLRGELVEELRDRLGFVERQLEAERQAHAEARRLLAAALERIPPQLEAPQEPPEGPETPSEPVHRETDRERPFTDEERPQERRGFWARLFGGGG